MTTPLYAVVDKNGKQAHDIPLRSEDDAWAYFYLDSRDSVGFDAFKKKRIAQGYRCIELHTYNPATHGVYEKATQVVVDREIAQALLDSLVALREANVFVWPNHPMNPEKHLEAALDKFLSAGKE